VLCFEAQQRRAFVLREELSPVSKRADSSWAGRARASGARRCLFAGEVPGRNEEGLAVAPGGGSLEGSCGRRLPAHAIVHESGAVEVCVENVEACATVPALGLHAAPAHPRTATREHELMLALAVALKGRVCALGGAYPRACAPPGACICVE